MSTTFTEPKRIGDVLAREYDKLYTRENKTVAAGQNLELGTVIGIVTADGTVAAYDAGNADGTENAAGVLLDTVDATAAELPGSIVVRGPVVLKRSGLVGLDAAAETQLLALGLVIRDDLGGAPVFIS